MDIPRWKIKFKKPDGTESEIKLYYEDKQSAYNLIGKDFEIISIEQDTDASHVEFIDRIKSKSEFIGSNGNKQLYKYPYNDSFIIVIFRKNGDDYYDYLQFQRWDCIGHIKPILWTPSNPKRFYELFDKDVPELPQGIVVTPKEIKKMKAKKFWNKGGDVLWVDDLGYIYSADKDTLPSKYKNEEWNKFHDNPNAIKVTYVLATLDNIHGNAKTKWFESKESFLQFYETEKKNVPGYCTFPRYEIVRVGYKREKPEDRKVIWRLPYIDLDMELACGTPINRIAMNWCRRCDKLLRGQQGFSDFSFFMDVIERYKAYMNI